MLLSAAVVSAGNPIERFHKPKQCRSFHYGFYGKSIGNILGNATEISDCNVSPQMAFGKFLADRRDKAHSLSYK